MKAMAWTFDSHKRLEAAQKAAKAGNRLFGKRKTIGALPWPVSILMSGWSAARDTPVPPKESFRDWWKRERS